MEGAPKIEQIAVWRNRKENAPDKVTNIIDSIDGYAELSVEAQISVLSEKLHEYENVPDDTYDYYVCKGLARQVEILKEKLRHETVVMSLAA